MSDQRPVSPGTWLDALLTLRAEGQPGVLVTVVDVRGHAPRSAGAKMVVGTEHSWGSIGGGNIEAIAVDDARALLNNHSPQPRTRTVSLSDKVPSVHGVQCCGGEVTLLLEPMPAVPAVAIFGLGHVGLEVARILARQELDLHLVDTRTAQLDPERLAPALSAAVGRVHVHLVPLAPESVLATLPRDSHVLVMTHDHAEDLALCDAALRLPNIRSIGLIGSAGKWARFQRRLLSEGGHSQDAVDRIRTPIGIPGLTAKNPATIAVAVVAELLGIIEAQQGEPMTEAGPNSRSANQPNPSSAHSGARGDRMATPSSTTRISAGTSAASIETGKPRGNE